MIIASDKTRERHAALTHEIGYANQPRDFYWLEKNIPCQYACPAGTDIPEYLGAISRGDYNHAYKVNLVDNVFPAILGRVCSRPCEPVCRHGWEGLGEPVAICFSKRSSADFISQDPVVLPPLFEPTGKEIAVVGSGVAGLAAARNLALYGHTVTVFEKHAYPGGMLNQGIPIFRLPRNVIDKEVKQVELLGVKIVCNTEIGGDLGLDTIIRDYDAVLLAAGTLRPNIPNLLGRELTGIRHGLDFLLEVNDSGQCDLDGQDVVVIGGGFTAMDCARTALRLQVNSVKVYYRRSRDEMLVTEEELLELNREGISIEYMVSPTTFVSTVTEKVEYVRFVRTRLGDPDSDGRCRPIALPDSGFDAKTSAVLLATGQFPDTGWIDEPYKNLLVGADNWLVSGKSTKTAHEKIFVAGDFALGATTLIDAIGHAKKCARDVDTFLMGVRLTDVVTIENTATTGRDPDANSIERHTMPTIPVEERTLTAEVEIGFSSKAGEKEALRCYLCHYKYEIDNDLCIYCDGCLRVMPVDNCIVKVSALNYDDKDRIVGYNRSASSLDYNLLYIDQNECIRCGACADVCPVDCISLQKVSKKTVKSADVCSKSN